MKTTIDLWHKVWPDPGAFVRASAQDLERFATLVRADQDEKYKWDIHSCGPTCTKAACVAMREAVLAEREACADVVESTPWSDWFRTDCAIAIRNRGNI
jgi:hypothetical protein